MLSDKLFHGSDRRWQPASCITANTLSRNSRRSHTRTEAEALVIASPSVAPLAICIDTARSNDSLSGYPAVIMAVHLPAVIDNGSFAAVGSASAWSVFARASGLAS
ncbi:MAG: hypothetical protein QOG75_5880, partial [Mycobacterium sp.]|nr:hypothetical protein [Mycobacterium sp.]